MSPEHEREVRAELRAERDRAVVRLRSLEADVAGIVAASADDNADDEHDPEGATIAFERSQAGALAASARARLTEVDAALDRLAAGRYGRCEACGQPLPAERLAVRPTARTHVGCA